MFFSSSNINEAKRNTEHQVKMFEIIHEVDNCPVGYFLLKSKDCSEASFTF